MKKVRSNHAGFTLMELIIAVSILAVLTGVVAPQMLKYVWKAKRVVDVDTAQKIVEISESVAVGDVLGLYTTINDKNAYISAVYINQNSSWYDPPQTMIDCVMEQMGHGPKSQVNKDLWWAIKYRGDGTVEYIRLVEHPKYDGVRYYELYPNSTMFMKGYWIDKTKK